MTRRCRWFGCRWHERGAHRICERCDRFQERVYVEIPAQEFASDNGWLRVSVEHVARFIWLDV